MEEIKAWRTTDGRIFSTEEKASIVQDNLDKCLLRHKQEKYILETLAKEGPYKDYFWCIAFNEGKGKQGTAPYISNVMRECFIQAPDLMIEIANTVKNMK